ncbi:hypothetical protein [Leisingera sp. S232]|uniref:hypothetical protein n=1 Tax=Leisingera sp. S232 TaxID=3415132 RepID=UPI003C7C7EA5
MMVSLADQRSGTDTLANCGYDTDWPRKAYKTRAARLLFSSIEKSNSHTGRRSQLPPCHQSPRTARAPWLLNGRYPARPKAQCLTFGTFEQALGFAQLRRRAPLFTRPFSACTPVQFKEQAGRSTSKKHNRQGNLGRRENDQCNSHSKKQQPRQIDFPAGRGFRNRIAPVHIARQV